jgi:hypothetical protein
MLTPTPLAYALERIVRFLLNSIEGDNFSVLKVYAVDVATGLLYMAIFFVTILDPAVVLTTVVTNVFCCLKLVTRWH